jgi:hypothetical protein
VIDEIERKYAALDASRFCSTTFSGNASRAREYQSPVFVGSAAFHDATAVRYIAPDADSIPALLTGLRAFDDRTRPATKATNAGESMASLIRAGALSFAFVDIRGG